MSVGVGLLSIACRHPQRLGGDCFLCLAGATTQQEAALDHTCSSATDDQNTKQCCTLVRHLISGVGCHSPLAPLLEPPPQEERERDAPDNAYLVATIGQSPQY